MGAHCVRWTADTERAFLLALRLEGQVSRAAAAIGRLPSVCHDRRKRRPAFAAAWDEVIAERERERLKAVAAAGEGDAPCSPRSRPAGWTQQRQRAFLRALADTGRYDQAAARVGLSYEAVRAFRRRSPEFQALCDVALVKGGASLEEAAFARAVEGWEEPVYHGGKLVGHRRRWSDALLRDLLRRESGGGVKRRRWERPPASADDVRAEILRKVAAVKSAAQADARAAQLAWCERMEREGKAP